MSDQCPLLEYRRTHAGQTFEHERPFCTAVERFVQPMRADICRGRHGLDHTAHCEYYREYAGLDPLAGLEPEAPPDASRTTSRDSRGDG